MKLTSLLLTLSTSALLALPFVGCAQNKAATYRPYYDSVFQKTGDNTGAFSVSQGVVSDLNHDIYAFEELRFYRRAKLAEDGSVTKGESFVFTATFIDSGEGITSLDDSRVTLRLQIEENGEISDGKLGSTAEGLASAFVDSGSDSFLTGESRVLYKDSDVAIGQFTAVFESYRIHANYRVMVYDAR